MSTKCFNGTNKDLTNVLLTLIIGSLKHKGEVNKMAEIFVKGKGLTDEETQKIRKLVWSLARKRRLSCAEKLKFEVDSDGKKYMSRPENPSGTHMEPAMS